MEVKIDALDITVLKGGAAEVGQWASENGSGCRPMRRRFSTSTPIAARSSSPPCSMPMRPGRGQQIGDGTPDHITIPTPNPWVRSGSSPSARRARSGSTRTSTC